MANECGLDRLLPGEKAVVRKLVHCGGMRRRLLDMGFVENTEIECVGRSPAGDPSAFLVRGSVVALRREDCAQIKIVRKGGCCDGKQR